MTHATYQIVTLSGSGLPVTVDAGPYDTRDAAEAMADEHHHGSYRIDVTHGTAAVRSYDTAERYLGSPSLELVRASADAEPTGAVLAYSDRDGVWQHVPAAQADRIRRTLGRAVVTVYVEP